MHGIAGDELKWVLRGVRGVGEAPRIAQVMHEQPGHQGRGGGWFEDLDAESCGSAVPGLEGAALDH